MGVAIGEGVSVGGTERTSLSQPTSAKSKDAARNLEACLLVERGLGMLKLQSTVSDILVNIKRLC